MIGDRACAARVEKGQLRGGIAAKAFLRVQPPSSW